MCGGSVCDGLGPSAIVRRLRIAWCLSGTWPIAGRCVAELERQGSRVIWRALHVITVRRPMTLLCPNESWRGRPLPMRWRRPVEIVRRVGPALLAALPPRSDGPASRACRLVRDESGNRGRRAIRFVARSVAGAALLARVLPVRARHTP